MAYIKKETIDKVMDVANLIDVIKEYVDLKKAGANYQGLSPFSEERTPSFIVSPAKGIWKDFSTGKSGNSAISFIMEKTGCSFPEAVETLARKYAIEIEYENTKKAKAYQEKKLKQESLRPLLEATIQKYEEQFANLPDDHPAKLEVFQKRGYTPEIVEQYRIGYAPGNNFLYDLCKEKGLVHDAQKLGLLGEKGDKWVDRVIYPLIDRTQPVGLAGRSLSGDYAKWMNSTESDLFSKSRFWYGLNFAREEIVRAGKVWIVEGYNDVISFQTNGIQNTVAPCGTAIADSQMDILKKFSEHVILCLDRDKAGTKAMLRYIPEFLKKGFRVQLADLPEGMDPDDYTRQMKGDLSQIECSDGFEFLMKKQFEGKDAVGVAQQTKDLVEVVQSISDLAMREIYMGWLQKESKLTKTQLQKFIKENEPAPEASSDFELYVLPKSVKEPLENLLPTIQKYDLFIADNQIWTKLGDEPPHHFKSVSNFAIEIIQHMQDEKFPMKLVRIKNIHGHHRVFDMHSSDMNMPMSFENAVTAHGNFQWKGGRKEHQLLKMYLFDRMGTGRKIDVLGWQPAEGFWVWNNLVVVPKKEPIPMDENGVFEYDGVTYYVPSANSLYRNSLYHYEAQKRFLVMEPEVNFLNYATQLTKVHREHGMVALLFTIASMFQDIVAPVISGAFPMLFLYGPASSGKDLLADCCQSFFGHPQTAINLEGGNSTMKAQVREFAQFGNGISQLSEYKPGDAKLDGMLKGLWDRRGYKRGTIESHVGTESIPILSSTIMTANFTPDQEALITRLIWCVMDKTTFTDEEGKEYEKLQDWTQKGISGYTNMFLHHRSMVQNNFKAKYREFRATLLERNPEANARVLTNLSVLGTFYQMFQNIPEVQFPFSHAEMMDHFGKIIDTIMNKLSSASIINRWWDCFLASMRGTLADQLKVGRDIKLEGDHLYFNFTSAYNRVQRQWYVQYRDAAPGKGVMMDALKKDKAWIDAKAGVRFSTGRDSKATSAYLVNLAEVPIRDEIKFAVDFQLHENSLFPPATPENEKNNGDADELPF